MKLYPSFVLPFEARIGFALWQKSTSSGSLESFVLLD